MFRRSMLLSILLVACGGQSGSTALTTAQVSEPPLTNADIRSERVAWAFGFSEASGPDITPHDHVVTLSWEEGGVRHQAEVERHVMDCRREGCGHFFRVGESDQEAPGIVEVVTRMAPAGALAGFVLFGNDECLMFRSIAKRSAVSFRFSPHALTGGWRKPS